MYSVGFKKEQSLNSTDLTSHFIFLKRKPTERGAWTRYRRRNFPGSHEGAPGLRVTGELPPRPAPAPLGPSKASRKTKQFIERLL